MSRLKNTIVVDGETITLSDHTDVLCPVRGKDCTTRCVFYHPREEPRRVTVGVEGESMEDLWEWREAFCGLDSHAGFPSRGCGTEAP